uniref:Putative secreted protein n=1 Tax=Anopheles marajoara TaxID=58244 RepID=A0A2M4C7W6_9DIPT
MCPVWWRPPRSSSCHLVCLAEAAAAAAGPTTIGERFRRFSFCRVSFPRTYQAARIGPTARRFSRSRFTHPKGCPTSHWRGSSTLHRVFETLGRWNSGQVFLIRIFSPKLSDPPC